MCSVSSVQINSPGIVDNAEYCKYVIWFYSCCFKKFIHILLFSGLAVINAADRGISFPLKRRDQMLKFVLKLMGTDDTNDLVVSSVEFLHTQVC